MAPLLEDPRIRQTWNNISYNAETATETAAAGIWTFLHNYINPCFSSIGQCLDQCTTQCFPDREERARRLRDRHRTRGRAEYSFDFYDDWDEEEAGSSGGLLGWGNDELDRLLAGSGSHSHGPGEQPPGNKRKMSYGTRRTQKRKGTLDGLPDPTIIPSTSALGFLQRLPFKIGGTLRYKPSAADLQEHPGAHRPELGDDAETEPLIDGNHSDDNDVGDLYVAKTRPRSSTTASGDTSDSFRSRGDLFPSDEEDDAVPLSDEFATTLGRRGTITNLDDRSSGKTSSKGKSREGSQAKSRAISRTSKSSSQSLARLGSKHDESVLQPPDGMNEDDSEIPHLPELQQEEERLRQQEEAELQLKREAAIKLASERGLNTTEIQTNGIGPETSAATYDSDTLGSVNFRKECTTINTGKGALNPMSIPTVTDELSHKPLSEVGGDLDETANTNFVPARLPKF